MTILEDLNEIRGIVGLRRSTTFQIRCKRGKYYISNLEDMKLRDWTRSDAQTLSILGQSLFMINLLNWSR